MIKIKDKEYKFKFGFKAILFFEAESGQNISEIGEDMKMSSIVDIAYCGLKSAGENVTKEWVIDAIDEDLTLLNVFTDAMSEDMAAMNTLTDVAKK